MLVAIILLFLATELPQGALALCSGLTEYCFHAYYAPLGDTMDIVALINNGINFALYCTMSAQFRQTFSRLIAPSTPAAVAGLARHRRRQHAAPADDHDGNVEDGDGSVAGPVSVSGVCGEEATWHVTSRTQFPEAESPESPCHLELAAIDISVNG